jgi:predicted nucleic acid-binding protein
VTLIDSSVWIAFWRGSDPDISRKVRELIKADRACITGIILTELLQGARTPDEMDYLKGILSDIPRLPLTEEVFVKAAELSFQLKKLGKTVHTTDVIIAASALLGRAEVFTLDEHFRLVKLVAPLRLTAS